MFGGVCGRISPPNSLGGGTHSALKQICIPNDARKVFHAPLAARTLGEFWGRRWNRSFSDVVRPWVYRKLLPRIGARWAMAIVFLVSGVGHDLLISVPASGGYGLCTAYFLIQGLGVAIERRRRSRFFTLAVLGLPLPLLFHPPFMRNVILPFLQAIGASP